MTAQKITITSLKVSISGTNTPVFAISIIPELKVAPSSTPALATVTAEFRKLTASLETPTKRSQMARAAIRARTV